MNGIKVRNPWAPADVALITDWCRKYPRGSSFDWRRIKAEFPEEWQRLLNQGRREVNIVQKGDYICRSKLKTAKPIQRYTPRKDKPGPPYTCRICHEQGFQTKQHLGIHVKMRHPGQKSPERPHRAVTTNQRTWTEILPTVFKARTPENSQRTVDYCPCCGTNLRAVRDAIK